MKPRFLLSSIALLFSIAASQAGEQNVKYGELFEKRTFKDDNGKTLLYRLLKPMKYNASAAYPLVIFLHGAGERGDDNTAQLDEGVWEYATPEAREKYPCFVLAPQCPKGKYWVGYNMRDPIHNMPNEPAEALGLTMKVADALETEFKIDTKRIYVTGLSMGGFGTFDLLARQPERIAAAIPICGGGDVTLAPKMKNVPIWIFHGNIDSVVKPFQSQKMIEALQKAGGNPGYTFYPDVDHDSWTRTYHDPEVMKWMFAQKKK